MVCLRARDQRGSSVAAKTDSAATMVKETKTRNTKRSPDVVARDYTINLHKRLHGRYPF